MPREWCLQEMELKLKVRDRVGQDEERWNSVSRINFHQIARELVLRSLDSILRVFSKWWGLTKNVPRRGTEKAKLEFHLCLEDGTLRSKTGGTAVQLPEPRSGEKLFF